MDIQNPVVEALKFLALPDEPNTSMFYQFVQYTSTDEGDHMNIDHQKVIAEGMRIIFNTSWPKRSIEFQQFIVRPAEVFLNTYAIWVAHGRPPVDVDGDWSLEEENEYIFKVIDGSELERQKVLIATWLGFDVIFDFSLFTGSEEDEEIFVLSCINRKD